METSKLPPPTFRPGPASWVVVAAILLLLLVLIVLGLLLLTGN